MNSILRAMGMMICIAATTTVVGCSKKYNDDATTKNDLKEIHMAYRKAATDMGKPPANANDLKGLKKEIKSRIPNDYVVEWNIQIGKVDSSNIMLAYEKKARKSGGWAVTVAGTVKQVSPTDFQLQAQAKKGGPQPIPGGGPPPPPGKKPKIKLKTGLPRAFQIQEVQNLMKQLGLAYYSYHDVHRKGPPNYKALSPFYEKSTKITKMLSEGYWTFYYNVRIVQMRQGTTNTILAHEAVADENGRRVVLFGSGSVRLMNEADFQKAPKAGQN